MKLRLAKAAVVSQTPQTGVASSLSWSVRKRHRSRPHFSRKLYHLAMGLIAFFLYTFVLSQAQAIAICGIAAGLLVTLDLLRLRSRAVNRVGLRVFGSFMRREELRSMTGNSFYILGLLVVAIFFPKPIALLSVLYLAIGDPVAGMVGSTIGKTKLWKKKSLEGALANFTATSLASFLFGVLYLSLPLDRAAALGLVGGTISTLAELCPLPVDDNFTIPVLSALLLSVTAMFLPFL